VFTERHLAMLSAFANQAAVAIENARLYDNLRRSLDERLRLQDELHRQETQRLALEEASRLKSDFIGFVAHELRNPLTTIRGYVQTLMSDDDLDRATREEFYETIEADTGRLLDMIGELLDISRLEAGRALILNPHPVDLRALLEKQARRHRFDKFFTPEHRIVTEFAPGLPAAIEADESKLSQIVSNLLNNAIKYTPDGGEIRLAAAADGPDHVLITVQDHGIGMTEEQARRLFRKYERIERDAIRGIPGTGLGLYLVKHLVDLHGGAITAESAPGQGSTFRVRLPLSPPAA
jgi:signal transduction histidine kinase